jgi:type IV pilus assembly protein PilW
VVCDFDHATIFKASGYNDSNVTVGHNVGTTPSPPENCSKGLGYPTLCDTNGNTYKFGRNSQIARFAVSDWYVGDNNRPAEGGRSLFRKRLAPGGVLVQEEIAAGVTNMQIAYRLNNSNDFVAASSVAAANWANVNALQITLTVQSTDQRISTDATVNSGRLQRNFTSVITFRNRVP